MKNKIICLVLSLVLVSGLLCANGTYAWFMTFSGAGSDAQSLHNLSAGNIGYSLYGNFKSNTDERIEPKENLLADLSAEEIADLNLADGTRMCLTGTSLVDTQVRIKVLYTYIDADGKKGDGYDYVGTTDTGAPFVVELAKDSGNKTYWQYNETDNYFYYCDSETSEDTVPGVSDNNSHVIPLFSAMYYSGEYTDIPTSVFKDDNVFTVKIIFEAKQADYVTWEAIGEIGFETVSAA